MKRLKQLRESANYSQQQLAAVLKTTQQTIARWENGKAEPNLAMIRALAAQFGTSIDDLLGLNPKHHKMRAAQRDLFETEVGQELWGRIGLTLESGPAQWFPVTADTAARVRANLATIEGEAAWLCFPTLNNRYVAFRPAVTRKIRLLDAARAPLAEDGPLPAAGYPLELYRAFERLHEAPFDAETWQVARAALPAMAAEGDEAEGSGAEGNEADEDGAEDGGNPAVWSLFVRSLAEVFPDEVPEDVIAAAARHYVEAELDDPARFIAAMHESVVHGTDGRAERAWIEPRKLTAFLFDIEIGEPAPVVDFELFGGSAELFYPMTRLGAVIMPLIDILDAGKA